MCCQRTLAARLLGRLRESSAAARLVGGPSEHEEGEEVDREDPEREAQQRLRE